MTEARTDRDINATTVAVLLGFDYVERFEDLPAGFRHHWVWAEEHGFFKRAKTMKQMRQAYFRSL
ncbi:MAG: hypothetical protein ACK4TP_07955 [Hyphomicrobium sp.]